jgi:Tat protein secretion system quality control protein TatD with DNase activity
MGDRSGGREAKGSSLKKSKSNPGSTVALKQKAKSLVQTRAALSSIFEEVKYIDNAVALASRLFEHDRDRMLKRGTDEGVVSIAWCNDMEKLPVIAEIGKDNSGTVYFLSGIHPDNVDRANKKASDIWLEKTSEYCCRSECIGVLSGLNLSRDTGTHFAQESLLASCCGVAVKFKLPLVLHTSPSSLDRIVEVLKSEGLINAETSIASHKVLFHDIITASAGDVNKVKILVSYGSYFSISSAGLHDAEESIRDCIRAIPVNRLVLCSDSPWRTPQNISDVYLRTLRNEPSNLSFILQSVATIVGIPEEELMQVVLSNSLTLYNMTEVEATITIDINERTVDRPVAEKHAKSSAGHKKTDSTLDAAAASFCCKRCRSALFTQTDVISHAASTLKTVFKAGQEEGLCQANLFVPGPEGGSDSRGGLSVNRDAADCLECGSKLGRYFSGESACACGVTVPGPAFRVNTAKVDIRYAIENEEQLSELANLSKTEVELASLKLQYEAEADSGLSEKKNKKKGKTINQRGAGNFSSFRNKSFKPNASRVTKGKEGELEESLLDEDDDEDDEERVKVEIS